MALNAEQREILRIQSIYRSFQDAALTRNGVIVSRFSQSYGAVNAMIRTDPKTKNGICQALTNRWIAAHAAGGSMWNDVYNSDGNIKISEMRALMEEFKDGTSYGFFEHFGISAPQKWNAEKYLYRHGVSRRQNIVTGKRLYTEHGNKKNGDPTLGSAIATDMKTGPRNGYRMISIKSAKGGHVFCAWVGGKTHSSNGDIAFFDSNFGDFWFPSIDDFAGWYDRLWQTAYGGTYGAYMIRDFGVTAGHVTKKLGRGHGTI